MDSIIWAFRHTERNIAETGLNLLLEMLKKFQVWFCIYNLFYSISYYVAPTRHSPSFLEFNRYLSSVISFIGRTFWQLSKRYLLFWRTHFTSLGSNYMFWFYSICSVWYSIILGIRPCSVFLFCRIYWSMSSNFFRWKVAS